MAIPAPYPSYTGRGKVARARRLARQLRSLMEASRNYLGNRTPPYIRIVRVHRLMNGTDLSRRLNLNGQGDPCTYLLINGESGLDWHLYRHAQGERNRLLKGVRISRAVHLELQHRAIHKRDRIVTFENVVLQRTSLRVIVDTLHACDTELILRRRHPKF